MADPGAYSTPLISRDDFFRSILPDLARESGALLVFEAQRLIEVSDSFRREFDFPDQSVEEIAERIFPGAESKGRVDSAILACLESRLPHKIECSLAANGSSRQVILLFIPFMVEGGKGIAVCRPLPLASKDPGAADLAGGPELFRVIADKSQNGILVFDEDLGMIYANPAAVAAYGLKDFSELAGGAVLNQLAPEELGKVIKFSRDWIGNKEPPGQFSAKIIRKDGALRVLDCSGGSAWVNGRRCALVTFLDVTEKIEAEKGLRESEEKFRLHFDNVTDVIFAMGGDLRVTAASPSSKRVFGFPPEEVVGLHLTEMKIFSPRSLDKAYMDAVRVLSGETIQGAEYEMVTRSGELLIVSVSGAPLFENGKAVQFVAVARDVTAKRRAEEELKKFKAISDQSGTGNCIVDARGDFTYVNGAMADALGYAASELVGMNFRDLFRVLGPERAVDLRNKVNAEESFNAEEILLERKDGTRFPALVNAILIKEGRGESSYIAATVIDISERRRARAALEASEERFRIAASLATDLIYEADPRTLRMNWYGDIDGMLGYEPGQFPRDFYGNNAQIHRDDRPRVLEAVARHLEEGTPFEAEYRVKKKDGTYITVQSRGFALRDESGTPTKWIGVNTDVTESKAALDALRQSEEKYRTLFERSPEMITLIGLDGRIIDFNDNEFEVAGWTKDQIIGKSFMELGVIPEDKITDNMELFSKILGGEEAGPIEVEVETRDKGHRWLENYVTFLNKDGKPFGVQVITRDVTDRKEMEKSLRESEMRFRLAAHVASDAIYEWDARTFDFKWFGDVDSMLGYGRGEFPRNVVAAKDVVHPDDQEKVIKAVADHVAKKDDFNLEYRLKRKDGSWAWISSRGVAVRDDEGKLAKWIGVNSDISAAKKASRIAQIQRELGMMLSQGLDAQSALDYSLSAAIQISEMEGGGLYLVDHEKDVLELMVHRGLSDKFVDAVRFVPRVEETEGGLLEGAALYCRVTDLPDFAARAGLEEGLDSIVILPLRTGERVLGSLHLSSSRPGRPAMDVRHALESVASHIAAVAARLEAEKALRQSEERARVLFKSIPAPTFTWCKKGEDFILLEYNDAAMKFTDGAIIDYVGMKAGEIYEREPERIAEIERAFREKTGFEKEIEFKKDGMILTLLVKYAFVPPDRVIVHMDDVTGRVRMGDEAMRTREKYRALAESAVDLIWVTGMDFRPKYVSPSVEALRGFTADEVMNESVEEALEPESAAAARRSIAEVLRRESAPGESPEESVVLDLGFNTKSGGVLWTETRATLLRDQLGRLSGIHGISRPKEKPFLAAGAREAGREAYFRSLQLESMGVLSSSVAHAINNSLAVMKGYAEILAGDLEDDSDSRLCAEKVRSAADQASRWTEKVKETTSPSTMNKVPVNADALVRETLKEMETALAAGPLVRIKTPEIEELINADMAALRLLVSNLAASMARGLMEDMEDAWLEVETGVDKVNEEMLSQSGFDAGPGMYFRATFKSDGGPEGLEIFKEALDSKRIGLIDFGGDEALLAAASLLARALGGAILAKSQNGKRTVSLLLPARREKGKDMDPVRRPEKDDRQRKILVVDDEEAILDVTTRLLGRMGYKALGAIDAQKAAEIITREKEDMDLAIIDARIPNSSGPEIMRMIRKIKPDIKIVACSGAVNGAEVKEMVALGAALVIKKPFSMQRLADAVKRVLEGGPDQGED